MKRILFLFLFIPAFSFSQSIDQGKLIGEVSGGLGIYHASLYDKESKITSKDTTGAFIFPVNIEYGLNKHFGVMGGLNYSNYIEGDSSNLTNVNGIDLHVIPCFHFINRDRFDMYIGGKAGLSYLHFNGTGTTDPKASGFGPVLGFNVGMRVYFGKVIGMFFRYNYTEYMYPNFKATDNQGTDVKYKFTEKGSEYSLGIMFKIN